MNPSKKILLISSEFPPGPGGIGQHAYGLATALNRKGIQVHVCTDADYASRNEIDDFDAALPYGFVIHRAFRAGFKTYFTRVHNARKVLRMHSIDVILLSGKFSLWTGLLLKYGGIRVPRIAILHGSEINLGHPLARWLTHRAILSADHLIPVSAFTKSLLPAPALQAERITVIPNGIEVAHFDVPLSAKMAFSGNPVLLTVGNVTRRKGQHRVIKSLPKILEKYPNACYHIVGLPTLREEFEQLAHRLGVHDHVVFHGRLPSRNELLKAYKAADVFLVLSENQPDGDVEGFGIVVLEANILGVPVIGAKGCGISDAINDGTNGYLVDGDSSEQVLDALAKILDNRKSLAVSSRQWGEIHDWNRLVSQYIEVMERVG